MSLHTTRLGHFFFQAEDGIRDYKVTGVQTCALPICPAGSAPGSRSAAARCRGAVQPGDRKSTRLNSSHLVISYAVFCLKKKKNRGQSQRTEQAKHLTWTSKYLSASIVTSSSASLADV